MEDDDDFGELYSDVLLPFTTTSEPPPSLQIRRPIDPNNIDTLPEPPNSDSNTINIHFKPQGLAEIGGKTGEFDLGTRVLGKSEDDDKKLEERRCGELSLMDEDIDVVVEEMDDKVDNFLEKDVNLGKEEFGISGNLGGGNGNFEFLGGVGESKIIPGLSASGLQEKDYGDLNFDEESDSDSDDDLQIVLNNDNEFGVMGMGGVREEEEDEDGDGLIILAENNGLGNLPMMENQEWGEDGSGTGADGERKELGDANKVNGGVAVHPKVGYGNHAFHHPFHSQFKYVRPGAAPLTGPVPPGPLGTLGQVRPPVAGPIPGRGRGDWRPSGIMQKGFHPGFGAQAWGSNSLGRGLDFTLPSHKTIFEVDINSFEDKIWRLPGIDMSDFFNFGLNEEGWKEYCKQLEQHRLETTMQSKIRTYESGRTEQDYDPDLPPELAAASGALDAPSENITLVTTDPGQDASNRARPLPPIGRPIQVETSYTERLPSVDTRQSRIRDSDAIIEINCQGSTDEDSPETDLVEPEDDHISEVKGNEIQDISDEHPKKERRRSQTMPFSSKPSTHRPLSSREATPQFSGENTPIAEDGRIMKGRRRRDRSPRKAICETTREKQSTDDQKEKSYESIDGKHSRLSLSPESVGAAIEQDVEHQLSIPNEPVRENSHETEREGLDLDINSQYHMLRDEDLLHSSEKQKSSSKVDLSQETDEIDDSCGASSGDNKWGSRNSKSLEKSREAVDEVSQPEGSTHMSKMKRSIDRDGIMIRRKGYSETKDATRRYTSAKAEESYPHKEWEPNYTNRLHAKTDGADRQRESDNSDRALHKKVEGLHSRRTRVEDIRTRVYVDEIGPSHRNRVRETERSEKDGHSQLREHLDIGSRRGNPEKVMGSKRNRDDGFKRRDGSIDSLHNKRRKEDGTQRREQTENEMIFHGNKDNSSSRRKRDDVLDERKRDQTRVIDDDVYTVRYEEKGQFQRERGERQRDREEWHLDKHSSEDMLSKRKREDVLSGMNSIRAAEEKLWSSHSRGKDEYRGSAREYYQKDPTYHSQQSKRSDRTESESLVHHRGREDIHAHGNQLRSDGKKARHEKVSTRDDRIANASDGHRVHERKPKEFTRKSKEHEGGYPNSVPNSGKNQDERSGLKSDLANSKGELKHGSSENRVHNNHHSSSAKLNEEVASDDEHHSRRGRSKLERWASHKEMDFSTNAKSSSSSLQIKEPEAQNSGGRSLGTKVPNQHPKVAAEAKQHSAIKDKDALQSNNADGKSVENKHLDTVEKLKKRSERFKLPMPGEKEITETKKVENELLPPPPPPPPSSQPETRPDIEIKPERPARKRRWTSN